MPPNPRDSPLRHVVRCSGRTQTGARCKRRTARTNLCFAHLETKEHLKIQKSQIRGGGFGLWSTVPRKKKQRVTDYTGEKVISHDPEFGGAYVLQIKDHPPTFIDARKTTESAGRYSNTSRARDGFRNNAHLSVSHRYNKAGIVMTQNLPNATKQHPREIFTAYGGTYFNRHE